LHQHIPKGYIYFAMGFSVLVEMLNLRLRQASVRPVNLRDAYKATKVVTERVPVVNMPLSAPAVKKASGNKKKRK